MNNTLTTKEHYNKYKDMQDGLYEIDLLRLVEPLYSSADELLSLFLKDEHLNNISMSSIDNMLFRVKHLLTSNYKNCSLAESCCFIKHILIYNVLEIEPIFEENIKNFNELEKEWFGHSFKDREDKLKWFLKNKHRWK